MIEILGASRKTGKRFSHWFERPCEAMRMKKALEKSLTAIYIGWYQH